MSWLRYVINLCKSPGYFLAAETINESKINNLKQKLNHIILKHSVRTSEKTQHDSITKTSLLMLFREINTVYTDNHKKPINKKCRAIDC
jgi:hypothetical protein